MSHLEAKRLARVIVFISSKLRLKLRCLPKAILLSRLLGLRGIRSYIFLGIKKDHSGNLHAHVWLKVGGQVVMGNLKNLDTFKLVKVYSSSR